VSYIFELFGRLENMYRRTWSSRSLQENITELKRIESELATSFSSDVGIKLTNLVRNANDLIYNIEASVSSYHSALLTQLHNANVALSNAQMHNNVLTHQLTERDGAGNLEEHYTILLNDYNKLALKYNKAVEDIQRKQDVMQRVNISYKQMMDEQTELRTHIKALEREIAQSKKTIELLKR